MNQLPTLEAGTMNRTPLDDNFGKEAFTVIKDIDQNNSPSKMNSYETLAVNSPKPASAAAESKGSGNPLWKAASTNPGTAQPLAG